MTLGLVQNVTKQNMALPGTNFSPMATFKKLHQMAAAMMKAWLSHSPSDWKVRGSNYLQIAAVLLFFNSLWFLKYPNNILIF